jgi:hypothetical protein
MSKNILLVAIYHRHKLLDLMVHYLLMGLACMQQFWHHPVEYGNV